MARGPQSPLAPTTDDPSDRPLDAEAAEDSPRSIQAALDGLAGISTNAGVVVMVRRLWPVHYKGHEIAGISSLKFEAPFQPLEIIEAIGKHLMGGRFRILSLVNGRWGPSWPLQLPGPPRLPHAGEPGAWGGPNEGEASGEEAPMAGGTMLDGLREDVKTAREETSRERTALEAERDKRRAIETDHSLLKMRVENLSADKARLENDLRDTKAKLDQLDREQRAAGTELATLRAAGPKSSPIEEYARIHALFNRGAAAEPGKQLMEAVEMAFTKALPKLAAAQGGEPAGGWAQFATELASGVRDGLKGLRKDKDDEEDDDEEEIRPAKARVVGSSAPRERYRAPSPAPAAPAATNGTAAPAADAPAPAPAAAAAPDDDEEEDDEPPTSNVIAEHVLEDVKAQIAAGLDGADFARVVLDATPEIRSGMVSDLVLKSCRTSEPENVYKYALIFATASERAILEGDAGKRWFLAFAGEIRRAAGPKLMADAVAAEHKKRSPEPARGGRRR